MIYAIIEALDRKLKMQRAISVCMLGSDCTSDSTPNLTSSPPSNSNVINDLMKQPRERAASTDMRIFFFPCSDAIILHVTEPSWSSFRAAKLPSTSFKSLNRALQTTTKQLGNEQSAFCYLILDQPVRHAVAVGKLCFKCKRKRTCSTRCSWWTLRV